jgi:hypothetical protein
VVAQHSSGRLFKKLGYMTTPVIVLDGAVIVGFIQPRLMST